MAYNKHVWASGETITSALLNNIEDGVDAISDLAWTFAGQKTFTGNDIIVNKADAGIRLEDTGGKKLWISSTGDKLRVYEDGVGTVMTDILSHQHGGTIDGLQIPHSNITSPGVDDHHNQVHGPAENTNRTRTVFVPGTAMHTTNVMGQRGNLAGPLLQDAANDEAFGTFQVPKDEEFVEAGTTQQCYLFFRGNGVATTGDYVITAQLLGFNKNDTGGGSNRGSVTDAVYTIGVAQEFDVFTAFQATMSTLYDMYTIRILRTGGHLSDNYTDSIIVVGFAIELQVDQ